jgi:hypothetical protein
MAELTPTFRKLLKDVLDAYEAGGIKGAEILETVRMLREKLEQETDKDIQAP